MVLAEMCSPVLGELSCFSVLIWNLCSPLLLHYSQVSEAKPLDYYEGHLCTEAGYCVVNF